MTAPAAMPAATYTPATGAAGAPASSVAAASGGGATSTPATSASLPSASGAPTASAIAGATDHGAGTSGGGAQAAQGSLDLAAIVPALEGVVGALTELVTVLQERQASIEGGGPGATAPGCSCCQGAGGGGASAQYAAAEGAAGAPPVEVQGGGGAGAAPAAAPVSTPASQSGGPVAPNLLSNPMVPDPMAFRTGSPERDYSAGERDKMGMDRIQAAPLAGLDEAHRFGLGLISGFRDGSIISGTNSVSDHAHGDAIDVSNGMQTEEMKAYAEYMRMAGQQGKLDVKYVVFDDKIASSRDGWAWRDYEPKGEVNATTRHLDHVHVSFN